MSVEHSTLDQPQSFLLAGRAKDELRFKFSRILVTKDLGLNLDEREALQANFELYAVKNQGMLSYWTETSLSKFLRSQLPPDLAYHVVDAAPLLYRSVLRLASYPYVLEPAQVLTADALITAVAILCRRPIWASQVQDVSEFWFDRVERKRRRLLFQSLMDKVPTTHYISRTEKDDEDLNDVLNALEEDDYSVWHADASNGFEMPFSHTATKWPSSDSGELNGTIPRYEFRSWLRLALLSRLQSTGDVRWRQEMEAVSDSVLDCFNEHNTGRNGISWQAFDKTLTDTMPFLYIGLSRMFEPLLRPFSVASSPLSMPVLSQLLSALGHIPSFSGKFHKQLPPQELTHPILCQLATFLPLLDVREHIMLSRTEFVEYSNERTYPGLMLLSGLGITNQSSDTISHVMYGAFFGALPDTGLPFDRAGQVCIFQLAPIQRVFIAARAPRIPDALDLTFSKEVARRGFKVELVTDKSEMVELIIEDGMKNASFAQWGSHQDEGSDRTLIGEGRNEDEDMKLDELFGDFRIEDMKLLGFPRQTE